MLGRFSTEEIEGYSNFIFLFLAKTGRPLMPAAVNTALYNVIDAYNKKKEMREAEKERREPELLPKISVHSLWHTACTNMARKNMNVKALQYIMGHTHSDITMDVYNHLSDMDDIRREVEKYEKEVGAV